MTSALFLGQARQMNYDRGDTRRDILYELILSEVAGSFAISPNFRSDTARSF